MAKVVRAVAVDATAMADVTSADHARTKATAMTQSRNPHSPLPTQHPMCKTMLAKPVPPPKAAMLAKASAAHVTVMAVTVATAKSVVSKL